MRPEAGGGAGSEKASGPSWAKALAKQNSSHLIASWLIAPVGSIAILGWIGTLEGVAPWLLPATVSLICAKTLSSLWVLTSRYNDVGFQVGLRLTGMIGQAVLILVAVADPFHSAILTFMGNLAWSSLYGFGWAPLAVSAEFPEQPTVSKVLYGFRQFSSFLDTASDVSVGVTLVGQAAPTDLELGCGITILVLSLVNVKSTELNLFNVYFEDDQLWELVKFKIFGELPIMTMSALVASSRQSSESSTNELLYMSIAATIMSVIATLVRWVARKYFGVKYFHKAASRMLFGTADPDADQAQLKPIPSMEGVQAIKVAGAAQHSKTEGGSGAPVMRAYSTETVTTPRQVNNSSHLELAE